jgi:hypothetical protein
MAAAPRRPPLEGTERLIVDGTNLLYRLGTRAGGAAPASAIVGRIRAAVPATVAVDLVFDGSGHGVYGRVAQQMLVRYSGKRSADDTILDLVSEVALQGRGAAAADTVLVVTDDRALRDRVAAKGGRSAPLAWLTARLDLPAAPAGRSGAAASGRTPRPPSIGHGRPPAGARRGDQRPGSDGGAGGDGGDDRPGWTPGRGATAKRGTPRRVARHRRHPRAPG